jgi:hypothetical protein
MPSYVEIAADNTHGLRTIPENVCKEAYNNLTKFGCWYDTIDQAVRLFSPYTLRETDMIFPDRQPSEVRFENSPRNDYDPSLPRILAE